MLVAGYHKNLENGFWGLSNATQNLVNLYGQTGGDMTIDGHSRGGMITGNALDYLVKEGFFGQNTTVNLFGSAYNAQDAANHLNVLTNGTGQIYQSTHDYDFVGRFLGWNPGTGGMIPENSSGIVQFFKTFGGTATVHNCYGPKDPKCPEPDAFGKNFVPPARVPVAPNKGRK